MSPSKSSPPSSSQRQPSQQRLGRCSSLAVSTTLVFVVLPLLSGIVVQKYYNTMTDDDDPSSDLLGSGKMFDAIASRYDFVNRVLGLGMDLSWRRVMVETIRQRTVGVQQQDDELRILDVATGTADVALLLAEAIPSETVVGVDPSSGMLEVGRRKVQSQNLQSRIRLETADAQILEGYKDSQFDAATMSFGIRNVPDRSRAVCQVFRVLKPAATFCILEFSEPDGAEFGYMGRAAKLFIRHVVPFAGSLLSGAPQEYRHLQNSIRDFPSPDEFSAQLRNVACDDDDDSEEDNEGQQRQASFELDDIVQLNFGSVQLYVLKSNKKERLPSEKEKDGTTSTTTE